jgi:hypothetical protein
LTLWISASWPSTVRDAKLKLNFPDEEPEAPTGELLSRLDGSWKLKSKSKEAKGSKVRGAMQGTSGGEEAGKGGASLGPPIPSHPFSCAQKLVA